MADLTIFKYESKEVRTLNVDGNPFWVAKDVCEVLGYGGKSSISQLISIVPSEWKGIKRIDTLTGKQKMSVLSEEGLYFFLNRSYKERAKPFQKWIAGEVIPAIRKTGSYSIVDKPSIEQRTKSKKVRNDFTDTLQKFGCEKAVHYINVTKSMKKNLGIDPRKKKDNLNKQELALVMTAEMFSYYNLENEKPDGYREVKPICDDSSKSVAKMVEERKMNLIANN